MYWPGHIYEGKAAKMSWHFLHKCHRDITDCFLDNLNGPAHGELDIMVDYSIFSFSGEGEVE